MRRLRPSSLRPPSICAGLDVADVIGSDARFASRGRPSDIELRITWSYGVNGRSGGCRLRSGVAQSQHEAEQGAPRRRKQSGWTEHPGHGVIDSAESLALKGTMGGNGQGHSQSKDHFGVASLPQLGLDTSTPSSSTNPLARSSEWKPGSVSMKKPLAT